MARGRPLHALHALSALLAPLHARSARAVSMFALLALAWAVGAREAAAHTLGLSSGEYKVTGAELTARVSFAVADGLRLVPTLDADGDGRVSAAEVPRATADLGRALSEGIVVTGDGGPCRARLADAALTEGDGLLFELVFTCESAPREVALSLPLLTALGEGHRHVARTVGASTSDALLSAKDPRVTFRAPDAPSATPAAGTPAAAARAPSPATRGFRFVLSVREHLLVLVGLALVPWTRRARLGAILAFAAGHAAALGSGLAWPRAAGVAAGAVIALFALFALPERARADAPEELVVASRGRWLAAAPLGLFTGLAFATASPALDLARSASGSSLAFGVGVLLAQLSIALPAAWLVRYARAEHALSARARRAMAVALALAGALSGVVHALGG